MDKTSQGQLFSNAKRIAVVTAIVYAIVKQLFFMAFLNAEYWVTRGIVSAVLVTLVFVMTRGKRVTSRRVSWMIPVSFILLETVGVMLTDGDQMFYFFLIGCTLLSFMFVNVFGLAVTAISASAAAAFYLMTLGGALMGQTYAFEYDVFRFAGTILLNGFIFVIGKYAIGVITGVRHEKELITARTETIIGNLPGMAYVHLYNFPSCTLTYVSEGSKEYIGYTPEELIGEDNLVGGVNKFIAMMHPDDIEDTGSKFEEAIEAGLTHEQAYRIIMPDGTVKWIMDRSTAYERNPDGTPYSVQGYMFDITEHRRLEIAELSELMLDTSPLCIQLIDRNHDTIGCNTAAVELYGFKEKQEYCERFSKDCSPEYQPDGQRSDEKASMLIDKAFSEGRCVFGWTHQMPDGTPIPAEITLVRVAHKGDFVIVAHTKDLRESVRLEAEAQKIYYDALTGIYNRRFFDEALSRLLKTLSRSGGFLSLMMIDVDFFKSYNDAYGHDAGDRCLKIVAETLSESITRTDDFVVRYGGEEFAVVLPNTDASGASVIAEKLLDNVRKLGMPHGKSDAASYVTISIGVATGRVKHTQSVSDYVKRADEMLYKSKRDGRNRYSLSS
ncbi:MAG: diguanylate cyclase [Oscillospiraceae bacterium]|nr:diguanylate cyclase [Oscillospiraceae bacterium]